MDEIKISCDNQKFQSKPSGDMVRYISNRLAKSGKLLSPKNVRRTVFNIGEKGCTFSPATFKGGKRNKENYEQQLISLDFDNKDPNKKISFEEVKERAERYELPVFFAYDTLSSIDHDKFRVVFLNDAPIDDRRVAEAVQMAMGEMFPEADSSCYKDVSKLYFGGKEVLYYDEKMTKINIESVFRNYTYCMKEKYKSNHYKDHIAKFAKETGIALNKNGLLDVRMSDYLPASDNLTEDPGAKKYYQNGKNSPSSIICSNNIIPNGEIFPKRYYIINFGTGSTSVKIADKKDTNHKPYRAAILQDICEKCKLLDDFVTGDRKLSHDELFGIATNLIDVESGTKYFMETRARHSELYADEKTEKWKADLSYMVQNDYKPERCEKYCPYHDECVHSKNILATVHTGRGSMERIAGYYEDYCSIEVMQKDVYDAIRKALFSHGSKFYVVKAQVGAGKSHSYLKLMKENDDMRFLIAAPTNLLKNELYENAMEMGIEVKVTPSLEEIKDEIDEDVWNRIQKMYRRGQYRLVQKYIQEKVEKEDIPCLKEYMEEREKLRKWKGCVITTHRYLLSMDKKKLDAFDSVIIDEDIIFKSVISNQEQITVSQLEKLKKKTSDPEVLDKIKKLQKEFKKWSCIEAESIEWDVDEEDMPKVPFDLPSFCQAERFFFRRDDVEEDLDEGVFTFLKAADFPGEKYIIVSATVNEQVCNMFFGEGADFYECKKAENKGTLKQYPQKSMSRSSIAKDSGITGRLMERFGMDTSHTITFKKENIGDLHFGNTEGSNALEGEDILVIGTPYHAEFIYKLAAWSMGLDFDEDEKMELQEVVYNGYRFRFTTFKDKGLRTIQLWMIESELEQAVGRARLLRKVCTVHLFSNFPLSQSEMIKDFDYGGG